MVILQIILNRAVTLHFSNMSERSIAKVAFSFHIKTAHGGVQPVEKGKGEVTKVKAVRYLTHSTNEKEIKKERRLN